jgi:Zn-dependent protease
MEVNLYYLFCVLIVTLGSMILHEIMHGVVALWQGDQTAKLSGRLSLNPLKHIDPMMTIVVPLFLALTGAPIFGGAKPVPINTRNLKRGEFSFALVALAGPLTNFILAFIFFLLYSFVSDSGYLGLLFDVGVGVNLGFMLFNLIPIPPLDGSRVLYFLAPDFIREFMQKLEGTMGIVVIYVLILVSGGLLGRYMSGASEGIINFFYLVTGQ